MSCRRLRCTGPTSTCLSQQTTVSVYCRTRSDLQPLNPDFDLPLRLFASGAVPGGVGLASVVRQPGCAATVRFFTLGVLTSRLIRTACLMQRLLICGRSVVAVDTNARGAKSLRLTGFRPIGRVSPVSQNQFKQKKETMAILEIGS
jgi:hypothetical protein